MADVSELFTGSDRYPLMIEGVDSNIFVRDLPWDDVLPLRNAVVKPLREADDMPAGEGKKALTEESIKALYKAFEKMLCGPKPPEGEPDDPLTGYEKLGHHKLALLQETFLSEVLNMGKLVAMASMDLYAASEIANMASLFSGSPPELPGET